MASKDTLVLEAETVVVPPHEAMAAEHKKVEYPPEVKTPAASPSTDCFALADVVLRFLLFASALVAVVVMVTSKQTEKFPILPFPPFLVALPAKFTHSPAFIYFVAALSVAGLYGIITTLLSFYALLKPGCCPTVLSHFVIFDLLLGIVAAATGAAGGVAYIGLKGNSHVGWKKVCNVYDEFCRHLGASIAVSLFGSIVLVLLVLLSVYSLSKKIPK
ncbi:CASP 1 [Olea europaea subsp. europaea]|uniref:CASP-like protein n=1 Tax=Olea europaea subsp. europaea TaxID=158383 RepID=A0A8S0VB12_OLEEU|nr:CASP 1 [Olea europaea subsp. europaea]